MPLIRGKQLENSAISGNKITANSILTGHISLNVLTNAQHQSASISGNVIASQSILNGHLASASISGNVISADTVTFLKTATVGNNSVTNAQLQSASVSGNVIAANSILTGHLSDNSIQTSRLQVGSISGNVIATGAILPGNLATSARPGFPTLFNKNMSANVTVSDGDIACNIGVWSVPVNSSYIVVNINGIQVTVGDNDTTKDCYFGIGGSSNVKAISNITSGDSLRWNGSRVGYQLDNQDRVDFLYDV